jgi:hypothetical protein
MPSRIPARPSGPEPVPIRRRTVLMSGLALPGLKLQLSLQGSLHLSHHDSHLLAGPSPRYPEVTFVR